MEVCLPLLLLLLMVAPLTGEMGVSTAFLSILFHSTFPLPLQWEAPWQFKCRFQDHSRQHGIGNLRLRGEAEWSAIQMVNVSISPHWKMPRCLTWIK